MVPLELAIIGRVTKNGIEFSIRHNATHICGIRFYVWTVRRVFV